MCSYFLSLANRERGPLALPTGAGCHSVVTVAQVGQEISRQHQASRTAKRICHASGSLIIRKRTRKASRCRPGVGSGVTRAKWMVCRCVSEVELGGTAGRSTGKEVAARQCRAREEEVSGNQNTQIMYRRMGARARRTVAVPGGESVTPQKTFVTIVKMLLSPVSTSRYWTPSCSMQRPLNATKHSDCSTQVPSGPWAATLATKRRSAASAASGAVRLKADALIAGSTSSRDARSLRERGGTGRLRRGEEGRRNRPAVRINDATSERQVRCRTPTHVQ